MEYFDVNNLGTGLSSGLNSGLTFTSDLTYGIGSGIGYGFSSGLTLTSDLGSGIGSMFGIGYASEQQSGSTKENDKTGRTINYSGNR
jgi:hypothetical protein